MALVLQICNTPLNLSFDVDINFDFVAMMMEADLRISLHFNYVSCFDNLAVVGHGLVEEYFVC